MTWALHRVSLATHDLAAAHAFFGTALGLGQPRAVDPNMIAFGMGSRGVRICRPQRAIGICGKDVVGPVTARHVAIDVSDLSSVVSRLDRAGCSHVEAPAGDFDCPAIYTVDPALNVVAFCQATAALTADVQPWERGLGWGLHHVNLAAGNVRETVAFYTEIGGLAEGRWQAPASRGDFSIDPNELAIMPVSDRNRGLHIIRPDAGFAHRNNFSHNPSIGGHPAIYVKDVMAVKHRLSTAGTLVSDAGVYAMVGMHQIYALDPTANMIEVNQFI